MSCIFNRKILAYILQFATFATLLGSAENAMATAGSGNEYVAQSADHWSRLTTISAVEMAVFSIDSHHFQGQFSMIFAFSIEN